MIKTHSKLYSPEQFQPGDLVTLKISPENQASTDNVQLYCPLMKEPHPNQCHLQRKHNIFAAHNLTNKLLRITENPGQTNHTELLNSPTTQVHLNRRPQKRILKL
jgi:hypothetical protein